MIAGTWSVSSRGGLTMLPDAWATAETGGLLVGGGQRAPVRTHRAATDVAIVVSGARGGAFPRAVIGHRTFDAKPFRLEIGDDQEERLAGWVGFGCHGSFP